MSDQTDYILQEILTELRLLNEKTKTNIHVNSVDEALAAKQNITNKQALQYRQR